MTEVDPDGGSEGHHGHDDHHEPHEHHKHRDNCFTKLEAVSTAELGLIREIMKVHEPDELGKGWDVGLREDHERSDYNDLEVVAAWKVDPEAKHMQAYMELRNQLNNARSGDHWVPTAQDAAVARSRQNGLLGDNEYWMLHGATAKRLKSHLCQGASEPGPGAFGEGVYMADEAEKLDQYVTLDTGANYLKAILEQPLDNNTNAVVERQGGLYVATMVRAYLGHQAELQVYRQRHSHLSTWYWFDPQTERTEVVERKDVGDYNSEKPPFDGTTFDSVKVMCSHRNKDFKHRFPNGFNGNFPKRFNEYLVPSSERLAIQYIIAYERVNALAKPATTPEQPTQAATTPVQPTISPATTKNGAAGNSAGSLLAMVLILAVYYLH